LFFCIRRIFSVDFIIFLLKVLFRLVLHFFPLSFRRKKKEKEAKKEERNGCEHLLKIRSKAGANFGYMKYCRVAPATPQSRKISYVRNLLLKNPPNLCRRFRSFRKKSFGIAEKKASRRDTRGCSHKTSSVTRTLRIFGVFGEV